MQMVGRPIKNQICIVLELWLWKLHVERRTFQEGEYHVPLMSGCVSSTLAGNIMDAVDERLKMEFDPNEMQILMMVGLWCTCPNDKDRPKA
ncbi:hypothetical protein FEM48_Zijuj06G0065900 [Ziziphus jujuba var. spinosa]|uniref:Uncharacterized protein n=1 Tax=Ziziphus jujuba var. spinosa TaxID=714518 RepID=A0A978V7R0_ZIZJJ|nr:hypothetical protein FEM48_Zijuj06G0065900 [Ziziphus jujuba var. spinosa]